MTHLSLCVVFLASIWLFESSWAKPPSGLNQRGIRAIPPSGLNPGSSRRLPPLGLNQRGSRALPPKGLNQRGSEAAPPLGLNQRGIRAIPPSGLNPGSSRRLPPMGLNQRGKRAIPPLGLNPGGSRALPPTGLNQRGIRAIPPSGLNPESSRRLPPTGLNQRGKRAVPPLGLNLGGSRALPPKGLNQTGSEAAPPSGLNQRGIRVRRDHYCKDPQEYPHGDMCCLNCPTGTHLKSHCTRDGQKGQCEECDYGSFTEHPNRLEQCFKCTQCRSDQEVVSPCTHTQDTQCQCKAGRFCAHDQACEVCKKCISCGKDEVVVRNCTSTTNTQCKKAQTIHGSGSAKAMAIWLPILGVLVLLIIIITVVLIQRRYCRKTDSQTGGPEVLKPGPNYTVCSTEERKNGQPQRPSCSSLSLTQLVRVMSSTCIEDERQGLCNSLSSSASNSQHSLTGLPACTSHVPPPQASPMVLMQPNRREVEDFPMLDPENGEESLRKCFVYFEEMDIDYHKRFFRSLEIDNVDNLLKSTAHLPYEDQVHEMLTIWVEQKGKGASLNDLLRALLDLNQRRTAENIKENAVREGHYLLAK